MSDQLLKTNKEISDKNIIKKPFFIVELLKKIGENLKIFLFILVEIFRGDK